MLAKLFRGRLGRRYYLLGLISLLVAVFVWSLLTGLSLWGLLGARGVPVFVDQAILMQILMTQLNGLLLPLSFVGLLTAVVFILTLVLFISLSFRRCHDIGYDGLWLLLLLVPIAQFVLLVILILREGELKANQFGAIPEHDNFTAALLNR